MTVLSSRRTGTSLVSLYAGMLARVDWRISGPLLLWLAGLWALSWVAVAVSGITPNWVGEPSAAHFYEETQPLWLYVWSRWDGQWYLNIAYHAYGGIPYDAAFFPLYPFLVAVVHGVTALPWAGAGLVVSYASLALALVYLNKLARLVFERGTAVRAVLTLLLYPTAFFLPAVYTESLVLLLVCAAFYYARTGRWWLVAALAYAAGLSKIMGLALGAALVGEVLAQVTSHKSQVTSGMAGGVSGRRPWALGLRLVTLDFGPWTLDKIAAIMAAPAGLLTYMIFLNWRFGDPLAFVHTLSTRFWRGDLPLLQKEWELVGYYFTYGISGNDLPKLGDLAAFVLLCGLAIYIARNLRLSYTLLVVVFLGLLLLSGDVLSLGRYMLTLGPAFIGLAGATERAPRTWAALIAVFVPLQVYFALRFFLWNWVD